MKIDMPSDFFCDLGERRGAREQDHQVRMLDARDPDLLAVDDVAVALPHGGGLDLRRVGAGRRLGHGHRLQAQLAARDLRQVAPLLRVASRGAAACPCCTSGRGRRRSCRRTRLISSMITDASARPRPEPPYSAGISAASQPALRQRVDERLGIAARRVDPAAVRVGELGVSARSAVAHVGEAVGSRQRAASRRVLVHGERRGRLSSRARRRGVSAHRSIVAPSSDGRPQTSNGADVEQRAHRAEREARERRVGPMRGAAARRSSVAISGPCTTGRDSLRPRSRRAGRSGCDGR